MPKVAAVSGLHIPWLAAAGRHLGKHAVRGRAQHRVTRLPGSGRLALQARQAQAEHAIHARAVAAVQRIQLCLHVREAHLHSPGGVDIARIDVYAKKALQCISIAHSSKLFDASPPRGLKPE